MKAYKSCIAAIFASVLCFNLSAKEKPEMKLGNGESNWIITEGLTRDGDTLTFKEVVIDGSGWLVIHPFENGKPNGDKYVAASYLGRWQKYRR